MEIIDYGGERIAIHYYDAVVIGSGCAGCNAADSLYEAGVKNIALITEDIAAGASRNSGSDKQTYYKLSLASDEPDSVYELARTLSGGGSVDGDTALAEAAGSVRAFMKLVQLGVPFPANEYGEYVGYKTDHDPKQRATSCGPLTSRIMAEKLEDSVRAKNIPVFDRMQTFRLLTNSHGICGAAAFDLNRIGGSDKGLTVFAAPYVILATGGPGGVYESTVYPDNQTGMSGMALLAGARACNLQEWQYGLASVKFKWNVSGSYQQVLPKYIAYDGKIPNGPPSFRELLPEYFNKPEDALDMVFLKGYQWPFDSKKLNGSSLIDLIVHHETAVSGGRVFMDFRSEPGALVNGFGGIGETAYDYLKRSGALADTPIGRLAAMNKKAIEIYLQNGIDLYKEPLETAVAAQHHNGGIAVDFNWRTNIRGLYAAGEAAGTFGVSRPGGAALNSTQVGSRRAAQHIAVMLGREQSGRFDAGVLYSVIAELNTLDSRGELDVREALGKCAKLMTRNAAHIRDRDEINRMLPEFERLCLNFFKDADIKRNMDIPSAYKAHDTIITQTAVLSAMRLPADACGSRGSAPVIDRHGEPLSASGLIKAGKLDNYSIVKKEDRHLNDKVITSIAINQSQNTDLSASAGNSLFVSGFEPVRPLPESESWFETVWNARKHR